MKFRLSFLAIILAVGGYFFTQHFDVEGLKDLKLVRKDGSGEPGTTPASRTNVPLGERNSDTVRIASFNIQVLGKSKLNKPEVMQVLADIVRRFDVVAVQEIRSKTDDILPRFVDLINSTGRHYDYVIGPRLGRSVSKEQYAFIYDAQSIEVDRTATYTVSDPDDLLHREPMATPFRVRGPDPSQAFTFTLINIHTDPDETKQELNALDDVYRSVRTDGRGEDDVILLGDLNVNDKKLGQLGEISNITWLISGVPTNTRGTKLYDNIVMHQSSTSEFTGRAGVFDLIREYNLTTEQALKVSDHLPIWAEFSIYEGGRAGPVATRPGGVTE